MMKPSDLTVSKLQSVLMAELSSKLSLLTTGLKCFWIAQSPERKADLR